MNTQHSVLTLTVDVPAPDVNLWLTRDNATWRPQLWIQRGEEAPALLWTGDPLVHIGRPQRTAQGIAIPFTPTGSETTPYAYTLTIPFTCLTPNLPCQVAVSPPTPPARWLPPLRLPLRPSGVITPPRYIRVRHDPRNPCRQATAGQVDVIPFEEYVARVLPAEMPASWPQAALQAQAIAIRTYAWYHVLQNKPDFDVSDWTDFQVMCDERYPTTDRAVAATEGQALFFQGLPILAMYSAQNGHPTLGVPWLPYLTPVPDPVSLGAVRRGHGLGLSQWGAREWAERGWNPYQILAHYYPGADLYLPPAITLPVGTLLPLELENMTLGRGYPVRALIGLGDRVEALTVTATTREGRQTLVLTTTGPLTSSWLGTWLPPETFSSPYPITLTGMVQTSTGLTVSLGSTQVWRDFRPVTVSLATVTYTVRPQITLTVRRQHPPDAPLRLGVGEAWVWRAVDGTVLPAIGRWVTDTLRATYPVWLHPRGAPPATWHSPPITNLPAGRSYRAWFRLRAAEANDPNVVVYLDVVTADGKTLLGMRAVRGIEFQAGKVYQEYPVDFHLFADEAHPPQPIVFRVHAYGRVDLVLDRVLVTEYPRSFTPTLAWPLSQRPGPHVLIAKASSPTGRVSRDYPLSVTLDMPVPPLTLTLESPPRGWITSPLTLQGQVTTVVAAPDPASFTYRYTTTYGLRGVHPLTVTQVTSRTARFTVPVTLLPEGQVTLTVHGQDMYTYWGRSAPVTLALDLTPPRIDLQPHVAPNANGWFTTPVTLTVTAIDRGSGVRALAVCTSEVGCDTPSPKELPYTLRLTREGNITVTVLATDTVGHNVQLQRSLQLDLTPPSTRVYLPLAVRRPWMKVRWLGADTHPITGYDLQVWTEATGWRPWLTRTLQTATWYQGEPGKPIAFRGRAHDVAGWVGPWSEPVTVTLPHVTFLPHLNALAPAAPQREAPKGRRENF